MQDYYCIDSGPDPGNIIPVDPNTLSQIRVPGIRCPHYLSTFNNAYTLLLKAIYIHSLKSCLSIISSISRPSLCMLLRTDMGTQAVLCGLSSEEWLVRLTHSMSAFTDSCVPEGSIFFSGSTYPSI